MTAGERRNNKRDDGEREKRIKTNSGLCKGIFGGGERLGGKGGTCHVT